MDFGIKVNGRMNNRNMIKAPLYRIVSLEGFVSLCITGTERYVNPIDCWEDTCEGYLLQKLDSANGTAEVIRYLYHDLFDENINYTVNNFAKLQRARYSCYAQSWSKLLDSDAMWRIYSYNKHGIQIKSNEKSIRKMISDSNYDGLITRVQTVSYNKRVKEMKDILRQGSKADDPFFYKRDAFKHENEVRVVLQFTKNILEYTSFTAQAILVNINKNKDELSVEEKMLKAVKEIMGDELSGFYKSVFPQTLMMPIHNKSDYILGVRVHPQAEDWYVDLVEKMCESYGLSFDGKSDLYSKG